VVVHGGGTGRVDLILQRHKADANLSSDIETARNNFRGAYQNDLLLHEAITNHALEDAKDALSKMQIYPEETPLARAANEKRAAFNEGVERLKTALKEIRGKRAKANIRDLDAGRKRTTDSIDALISKTGELVAKLYSVPRKESDDQRTVRIANLQRAVLFLQEYRDVRERASGIVNGASAGSRVFQNLRIQPYNQKHLFETTLESAPKDFAKTLANVGIAGANVASYLASGLVDLGAAFLYAPRAYVTDSSIGIAAGMLDSATKPPTYESLQKIVGEDTRLLTLDESLDRIQPGGAEKSDKKPTGESSNPDATQGPGPAMVAGVGHPPVQAAASASKVGAGNANAADADVAAAAAAAASEQKANEAKERAKQGALRARDAARSGHIAAVDASANATTNAETAAGAASAAKASLETSLPAARKEALQRDKAEAAKVRPAPHAPLEQRVPPRVLVIGAYKGKETARGVVAVHGLGAVASVSGNQVGLQGSAGPAFWRGIRDAVADAYAPLELDGEGLACVVFAADAAPDVGARYACEMLGEQGVSVVPYATHCTSTPPDAEMHALGAFAAGGNAYVLSSRTRGRKVKYAHYTDGAARRVDRYTPSARLVAAVTGSGGKYTWGSTLDVVIDGIAARGV
jgi:hypothetical protein